MPQDTRTLSLYIGLGAIAAAVFAADLFTPLGVAVWILYILPVGLTLLGREPVAPILAAIGCTLLMVVTVFTDTPGQIVTWVAYVNRACGVVTIWTMALLARSRIGVRTRLEGEDWLRRVQTQLLEAMQGELSMADVGSRALKVLASSTDAQVLALYGFDGTALRLTATHALRAGVDVPDTFETGEGIAGEAVRAGRVTVLRDIPESFLPIRSALLSGTPRHVVVSPLMSDLALQGVLEAGFVHPPSQNALNLLERTSDSLAVGMRVAFFRDRLRALLEETQRQSEALRVQQEELRVANEELEQHSEILKSSQVRLEQQQAELEATNAQLETQAQELERRQHALVVAKQEAERASQYKSEFLANMSHELRTPLNSTLILAKLLTENRSGRLSAEDVRYAETIYSAGNSLLTLINDILDLSKIEAGAVEIHPEPIATTEIVDALSRTFQPVATEKRLEFTVDVTPLTPETIATDGQRLQQILTNLLSNAFKFTEHGGVVLRVGPQGSDQVSFEVRDTGVGIAPEQHAVIFEAFRQADGSTHRKFGGTGLGLSISRELAHFWAETLELSSAPGKGSVFTLTIPVRIGAVRTASPRRPSTQEVGAGSSRNRRSVGPQPVAVGAAASRAAASSKRSAVADDRERAQASWPPHSRRRGRRRVRPDSLRSCARARLRLRDCDHHR